MSQLSSPAGAGAPASDVGGNPLPVASEPDAAGAPEVSVPASPPIPPLYLRRTLAMVWEVSLEAISSWVKAKTFPPPDYVLGGAQVWTWPTVEGAIRQGLHPVTPKGLSHLAESDLRRIS